MLWKECLGQAHFGQDPVRPKPIGHLRELLVDRNPLISPPITAFDPPLEFDSGEGLRWTCTYENPTTNAVAFGLSAEDEMCFLWGYYYPGPGIDVNF